jgi:hypothetical protein
VNVLSRLIPVAGVLALFGLACGDDVTDVEGDTLEEVLAAAGRVEVLAPASHTITQDSVVDEGDYRVTYEKHDVVDNIESIVYLGLNDDIVWPGNLVKGDKAHDFVYEPIAVPRGPITLSLSLETATTGPSITRSVADPRLSTVRQGISDLLRDAVTGGTTVPARVEFSYEQVFNESHLELAVGADISYGAGSLDTRFDWNSTTKKTKIVAKYRQVYFTVDMDTPASLEAFFAPNTPVDVVAAALPAGSRPIYVAGVSYGMMALMFIESDFTEQQMKAAINGAYSGVADVKLSFGYTAREVMESSSIQIVVYGGATAGLKDLETGYQGFKNVIEASRDFNASSPGVPLAYKFRHLRDNTLALVTLTSQYTLVRPLQIRQTVQVTAVQFLCTMADDEGLDNTVDMDRFGVWTNGWNRLSDQDPGTQINTPSDQYGSRVYWWQTSGDVPFDPGNIHSCGSSFQMTYDTDNFDFTAAKLELKAYARDWDGDPFWNAPEDGWGNMTLLGPDMWGDHTLQVASADFKFDVKISVKPIN